MADKDPSISKIIELLERLLDQQGEIGRANVERTEKAYNDVLDKLPNIYNKLFDTKFRKPNRVLDEINTQIFKYQNDGKKMSNFLGKLSKAYGQLPPSTGTVKEVTRTGNIEYFLKELAVTDKEVQKGYKKAREVAQKILEARASLGSAEVKHNAKTIQELNTPKKTPPTYLPNKSVDPHHALTLAHPNGTAWTAPNLLKREVKSKAEPYRYKFPGKTTALVPYMSNSFEREMRLQRQASINRALGKTYTLGVPFANAPLGSEGLPTTASTYQSQFGSSFNINKWNPNLAGPMPIIKPQDTSAYESFEKNSKRWGRWFLKELAKLPMFKTIGKATTDIFRLSLLMYASNKKNPQVLRKLALAGTALQVPESISQIITTAVGNSLGNMTSTFMANLFTQTIGTTSGIKLLTNLNRLTKVMKGGKGVLAGKMVGSYGLKALGVGARFAPGALALAATDMLADPFVDRGISNSRMNNSHKKLALAGYHGAKGAISGALTGAALGALTGASLGPWGAAIGALIGIWKGFATPIANIEESSKRTAYNTGSWNSFRGYTGSSNAEEPSSSVDIASIPTESDLLKHPVTSKFGNRIHPIFKKVKMHTGIDLGGFKTGDPVRAVRGGKVTYAGPMGGYGNVVKVNDGKYEYLYAHNDRVYSNLVGQQIKEGQEISKAGSSGNSTGTHVHFETKNLKTNEYEEPSKALKKVPSAVSTKKKASNDDGSRIAYDVMNSNFTTTQAALFGAQFA